MKLTRSENNDAKICKGIVFRKYEKRYFRVDTLRVETDYRVLKKQSCPGCEHCSWILSELQSGEVPVLIKEDKGPLYSVRAINTSTDPETGYIDSYELEIYPKLAEEGEDGRRGAICHGRIVGAGSHRL